MKTDYYWKVMTEFSSNPELLPFKKAVVGCCRHVPDDLLRAKVISLLTMHPEFQTLLEGLTHG